MIKGRKNSTVTEQRVQSTLWSAGPGPVPGSVISLTYVRKLGQYGKLHYCLATQIIERIRSERFMTISRILTGNTVKRKVQED